MIDKNTFGDTKAAIILAEMINEGQFGSAKISRNLSRFNQILNELEKIDSGIACNLALLSFNHYDTCASKLPPPFNDLTRNVLASYYKKFLVKQNAQIPYKIRKK